MALIKAIVSGQRTAALYITHDLAVVAQLADRIMVLRGGKLIEEGEAGQILTAPIQDYTAALVAERDHREPLMSPLSGTAAPLLQVRDVDAAYGDTKVLHNISLDLHRAETVAVVGESGSGKSTLAKVLTGLLRPTAGTITMGGQALAPGFRDRSSEELRRIQLVHQLPDMSLNPRQTLAKIIGRPVAFRSNLTGSAL